MRTILEIGGAVECSVIGRRNRFVVEGEVSGGRWLASINNTGRLREFITLAKRGSCMPQRRELKTDFRVFAVEGHNAGALIDTQLQMSSFEKCLSMGLVLWLAGRTMVKRNARLGSSLIDYMLTADGEMSYLEVKSAVLRDGLYAMYPDCPSARGRKHIRELTVHVRAVERRSYCSLLRCRKSLPSNRTAPPIRSSVICWWRHGGSGLCSRPLT